MGNDFAKGKLYQQTVKYGNIYLETDKTAYYTGETVTGKIYINLQLHYPGRRLFLKFKGKEVVHTIGAERQHLKKEHKIINMTQPIYTWEIMPSQSIVTFSFLLPNDLPNSFHQEGRCYLANISYRLEAILEPDSGETVRKMKYKQNLIVRNHVKNQEPEHQTQVMTPLTTWDCFSCGSNVLEAHFKKLCYMPGETAQVNVRLDNSQSKLDNLTITLTMRQRLTFNVKGGTVNHEFIKVTQTLNGIQKGDKTDTRGILLTFPPFQEGDYRRAKMLYLHEVIQDLKEDNSVMHSATKGKLITSEYILEVTCPMKGMCSETPAIIFPVEIEHPQVQLAPVTAPINWNPTEVDKVFVFFDSQKNIPDLSLNNVSMDINSCTTMVPIFYQVNPLYVPPQELLEELDRKAYMYQPPKVNMSVYEEIEPQAEFDKRENAYQPPQLDKGIYEKPHFTDDYWN